MSPRRDASIWLYSQHHFKNMTFRGPHLRAKTHEPLNQNEERMLREISRRCFSMQRYYFFCAQAILPTFAHRLTWFTSCCPFLLNICMALEFIFDNELQVAILKLEWIRDKIWSCWPHIEDIKKIKMVPLSAHWVSPREVCSKWQTWEYIDQYHSPSKSLGCLRLGTTPHLSLQ